MLSKIYNHKNLIKTYESVYRFHTFSEPPNKDKTKPALTSS